MLKVSELSVTLGSVTTLDSISMGIATGEVVAVIGPNGAGKSTLLKAIAGDVQPSNGQIEFHGRQLDQWDQPKLAQHVAVMPQKSTLSFPFTAREVVALARTPHRTGISADNEIVDEVLSYLDANYLAERIYTQLSGGEQQRVQLARVLAQIWQPAEYSRLLLLDEPSSSFDLAHQQMLMSAIREFSGQGAAILVVLHDLNMAMQCADKVAVLSNGKLRKLGPPNSVLSESLVREIFGAEVRFFTDAEHNQQFLGLVDQTQNQGQRPNE